MYSILKYLHIIYIILLFIFFYSIDSYIAITHRQSSTPDLVMVIVDWDFADVVLLLSQAGTRWWLPENGMTIDLKYKEKHNSYNLYLITFTFYSRHSEL